MTVTLPIRAGSFSFMTPEILEWEDLSNWVLKILGKQKRRMLLNRIAPQKLGGNANGKHLREGMFFSFLSVRALQSVFGSQFMWSTNKNL